MFGEKAAVREACKHQLLAKETTYVSSLHCGVTSGPSTLLWASITEIVVRYRHQDHQRCYGPQSQQLWSGTGTEDVRRELQELALRKTMSIWLIMGFINISVRPDRKTANSLGHGMQLWGGENEIHGKARVYVHATQ